MENKKEFDVLFGLALIAFLLVTFILIRDFNAGRANDYREYKAAIDNIVRMKNDKIRILAKENADLRNTLADTRKSLDALSKRLAPAPAVAPAAPAAPAAPSAPPADQPVTRIVPASQAMTK